MAETIDQSAFLDTFKVEAEEYLAALQSGLLKLEQDPFQPLVVDEMFRAAHTLKGVARMMGFLDIQEVAHHIEDMFGKIKAGKLQMTRDITTHALAGVDAMAALVQAVAQGTTATVDVPGICARLAGVSAATPAEPTPMPAAAPAKTTVSRNEEFIRIPVSRVNALFNLIGELVIHKVKSSYKVTNLRQLSQQTRLSQKRLAHLIDQAGAHGDTEVLQALQEYQAIANEQKREVLSLADLLSNEAVHLDPVIDELQYRVRELRMLPCSTIFEGFGRLVRDIAVEEQKAVRFVVEGEDTELDKKVLEVIKPCLVHLLRNAVDHGVELPADRTAAGKPAEATVTLRALQQAGHAVIEVTDDGRGIDVEQIRAVALKKNVITAEELARLDDAEVMNLIFAPGFSTSSIITDISGRGVGMDVVRKEVEQLRGEVSVHSQVGQGTLIRIKLPLTLAIMQTLLVKANRQQFGLPMLAVEEIVRVAAADVQTVRGRLAVTLRDKTLPLVRLSELLGVPAVPREEDGNDAEAPPHWTVVVASAAERRVGLVVDAVVGEEEIFIKRLPAHLGAVRNVSGASILGTGEVVVVLDTHELINSARQAVTRAASQPVKAAATKRKRRVLVTEDSLTTREFERSLLESHGYEVETAVDGLDGLEKLAKGQFDLVMSDVQMPRMDGFEFCRNIRQRAEWAELPVVFCTTLNKDEEKRRGIEVGAQAYIVKGAFDQSHLLETIHRLIG